MVDFDSGAGTRRQAAEAVAAVLDGRSLTEALPTPAGEMDARDRAFVQELAYGTVRWWPRLSFILARLMERKPNDSYLYALLGCGLYQQLFMRVPAHAAVAATVAAAPRRMRALCNAVLRNAQRQAETLAAAVAADEVAETAHPRWLLDRLRAEWPSHWPAIVEANNSPAPMTLRVRGDRVAWMQRASAAGITAHATRFAPQAVRLAHPIGVDEVPGFAAGEVSVQDEAAQLAAGLLDVHAGMRVLDACAAPGGKTAHILELQPQVAELVAVDNDAARMTRVAATLSRLHLAANCVVADVAQPGTWWDGRAFERILIDAPCSATGVIRRHPDIRLLRRDSDIGKLAARQRAMLDALWPLLGPGGRLVYATCSVLRGENDEVISAFVAAEKSAHIEPVMGPWGHATTTGRQVLPGEDGMDGFHYACLSKEGR